MTCQILYRLSYRQAAYGELFRSALILLRIFPEIFFSDSLELLISVSEDIEPREVACIDLCDIFIPEKIKC